MATVYLAEDLKHHRQVAIKVMLPQMAAAIGHDRFLYLEGVSRADTGQAFGAVLHVRSLAG